MDLISRMRLAKLAPVSLRNAIGFGGSMTLAWIVILAGNGIQFLYIRREPSLAILAMASGLLLVGAWQTRTRSPTRVFVLLWAGLAISSLLWSLAPAASATAAAWAFTYAAVFLFSTAFPRLAFAGLLTAHLCLLLLGIDHLVVTDSDFFRGVWFNKNVQAAQLMVLVPSFTWIATTPWRASPYAAFVVGAGLFLVALTRSVSGQTLMIIGVISVLAARGAPRLRRLGSAKAIATATMLVAGAVLSWQAVHPEAVQIVGVGYGTSTDGASLTKANTIGSLGHRLEMMQYGLARGVQAFPLGTGVGTTRDLYAGLKQKSGLTVPDLHNYYVQLWMTLGPFGVALFVAGLASSIASGIHKRRFLIVLLLVLLGGYLAFDVVAYFPAMMITVFTLMGVALAEVDPSMAHSIPGRRRFIVSIVALVPVVLGAWAWYTQPCEATACLLGRRLAGESTARNVLASLPPERAAEVSRLVMERNPESFWAAQLRAYWVSATGDTRAAPRVWRQVSEEYPHAHVGVYVNWYEAAQRTGDSIAAQEALELIRERYPRFDINDLSGDRSP